MRESTTILELRNLSFSFSKQIKNRKETNKILNEVSLKVSKGEICAIIGDNGSGKTTLFNIISGLHKPDSGEIFYKEKDLLSIRAYKRARLKIGRLFQDSHIFLNLTLIENLQVAKNVGKAEFGFLYKKSREKALIEEIKVMLLDILGADNFILNNLNKYASELSGGEQRILGMVRLFISDYDLILLDEPTASVDKKNILRITSLLTRLKGLNKTVLLIEHDLSFVNNIADKCFKLENHGLESCQMDKKSVQIVNEPKTVCKKELSNQDVILELTQFGFGYKKKKSRINGVDTSSSLKFGNTVNLIQNNLDIKLRKSDTLIITGTNGSGKSSLVKAILGDRDIIKKGKVIFKGEEITNSSVLKITNLGVGYFTQGGGVFPQLKVIENLRQASNRMSLNVFRGKMKEIYDLIPDLRNIENNKATYLSGGQRNMLALGMCLINSPELLILDEPTAGLTKENRKKILDALVLIKKETDMTLIIVEHKVRDFPLELLFKANKLQLEK